MNSIPPINIHEFTPAAIAAAAAILAILGSREKPPERNLYKPGELLIYTNENLDGYLVYSPIEDYETLFEGTLEECQEWIQQNTDYTLTES